MNSSRLTKTGRSGALVGAIALLFTALFATVGCGEIDDPENPGQPLWVLRGKLTEAPEAEVVTTTALRVAFIWQRHLEDDGVAVISQDVPVNPEFPARFTLEVYDPPPGTAMHDAEELEEDFEGLDFRIAVAQVLVYDDLNGNGRLDILPHDAEDYIDYVVGYAEDYMVVYVEGDPPAFELDGVIFDRGLNLIHFSYSDDSWSQTVEQLPLDTELHIDVGDDPDLQYMMCDQSVRQEYSEEGGSSGGSGGVEPGEYGGDSGGGSTGGSSGTSGGSNPSEPPDSGYAEPPYPDEEFQMPDLPEGSEVICAEDGSYFSFSYEEREQDGGICSPISVSSSAGVIPANPEWADEGYPEEWPCDAL